MNYKLEVIKETGESREILYDKLNWKDNIDTLGMQLNFNTPRNLKDRYLKNYDIAEIGDKILVTREDDLEIFRGIIADLGTNRFSKSITAFDYAFYLNKSKIIKQFNKIKADEAIKNLVSSFNIPIGNISSMTTLITKIYNNKTVSDIIKDIIKQVEDTSGQKFRMEMREGKLFIENYKDLIIVPSFKPAINVAGFNPLLAIGDINKKENIIEMKNKIVIYSGNEKKVKVVAIAKDDKSISKYGLLADTESVDQKELSQAKNIAKNKLNKLNKVGQNITLELLGDDNVRAGRIIEIDEKDYNLQGYYLVKNSDHVYENNNRKMKLTIEEVIV